MATEAVSPSVWNIVKRIMTILGELSLLKLRGNKIYIVVAFSDLLTTQSLTSNTILEVCDLFNTPISLRNAHKQ